MDQTGDFMSKFKVGDWVKFQKGHLGLTYEVIEMVHLNEQGLGLKVVHDPNLIDFGKCYPRFNQDKYYLVKKP